MLPLQGALVQSLIEQQGSRLLSGETKKQLKKFFDCMITFGLGI